MGYHYRGRHRAPSQARRNAAIAVTAGAAVVLPVLAPSIASAAELAPGVDWAPIIACESSGDPTVVNSTGHAGLLQFSTATWLRYGGGKYAPTADKATAAEQIAVADVAYAANGLNDWAASKSCWAGKVTVTKTVPLAPKTVPLVPKATQKTRTESIPDAKSGKTSWADAAAALNGGVYTVHKGDTLSGIAVRQGKPSWRDVYERNRDVVGANPNLILPGQQLQL